MKTKDIKKIIKEFIYKHKKGVCIALAATLITTGSVAVAMKKKASKNDTIQLFQQTVKVEKGEIYSSINVNGKIQSGEVSNVSTALTEKVKTVNVKVGDQVEVGDIICTLDDSDITKEIEKKKTEISTEKTNLQENYNKLVKQLESLKIAKSVNASAQATVVENASINLKAAENDLNNYQGTYKSVQNTYNTMLTAVGTMLNKYNEAVSYKDSCYTAWIQSGGSTNSEQYKAYKKAEENVNNKENELNEGKALYNYEEIKANYDATLEIYNSKISSKNVMKEQYETAVASRESAAQSDNAEIQSLTDSVNEAYKTLQKADENEDLKILEEKLAKTVLKAETAGKVTELKVNVGSVPEGQVATIQATNNLIIAVTIPEYEIKNTTVGMEAKISTDASEKKVTGKVMRISPTASSGDSSGFSADISVDNPEGMYIGTSAKVEIIISGKENVLMLPIDAVKEVGGKSTVFIEDSNGEFKEVEVTTGEKNDYYVEVSGDNIKEGEQVIADISTYDLDFQNISTETEVTNDGQ